VEHDVLGAHARAQRAAEVTRTDSGTRTRTSRVNHALAMSVLPTPKAKQPRAPAMQVCESVPATTWPGRAMSSMTALWQMACEPTSPVRSDLAVVLDALGAW
jgi:hypothetical protein